MRIGEDWRRYKTDNEQSGKQCTAGAADEASLGGFFNKRTRMRERQQRIEQKTQRSVGNKKRTALKRVVLLVIAFGFSYFLLFHISAAPQYLASTWLGLFVQLRTLVSLQFGMQQPAFETSVGLRQADVRTSNRHTARQHPRTHSSASASASASTGVKSGTSYDEIKLLWARCFVAALQSVDQFVAFVVSPASCPRPPLVRTRFCRQFQLQWNENVLNCSDYCDSNVIVRELLCHQSTRLRHLLGVDVAFNAYGFCYCLLLFYFIFCCAVVSIVSLQRDNEW